MPQSCEETPFATQPSAEQGMEWVNPVSGSLEDLIECFRAQLDCTGPGGSALTGSGYPLELSFTSASDDLRCTVDPFCQTQAPETRLASSLRLLETRLNQLVPAPLVRQMQKLQSGKLHYGAWLGLRQVGNNIAGKVYAEVSDDYPLLELPHEWQEMRAILPIQNQLRMVGYSTDSQDLELYFRCRQLYPELLGPILSAVGRYHERQEVIECIESAYGYPLQDRFPGGVTGVSFTQDQDGLIRYITLFVYCRSFWGRDRRCREQFSDLLRSRGLNPQNYRDCTAGSVSNPGAQTQHGMLAFTLARSGPVEYGIGYCPNRQILS